MKKEIIQTLKITTFGLLLSVGVSFAWTAMPAVPTTPNFPDTNTSTPINVGGSQVKVGALTTGPLAVFGISKIRGNMNVLGPTNTGTSNLLVSGKVGVGVIPTAMSEKFEVAGSIKINSVAYPNNNLKPKVCANTSGTLVSCP